MIRRETDNTSAQVGTSAKLGVQPTSVPIPTHAYLDPT
jgi:hypothetical protein